MKKNKALTAAISVLSLTMVSLCAIGGTFAKYVSNGSATDTATVAQWGVEVTVTGNDAFGTKYNDKIENEGVKVVSADTDNVLAPGTNGDLGSVTITGSPEVMVDVNVSLTLELEGWESNGTYCPLVFTVGSTEYKIDLDNENMDSVSELISAVQGAVNSTGDDIEVGTPLDGTYDRTVKWSWPIGSTDEENENDTALGNKNPAPTITATWSATVTQVD